MCIQFVYEDGKGTVVGEYGMPKPMDYIIDENPSAVLEQVMEQLKQVFAGHKVSKSTVDDCEKTLQSISQKVRFRPVDSNSAERIQERLDWICKWEKTDMDFTRNCVFLDGFAFHINMKRGYGLVNERLTRSGLNAQNTSTDCNVS